MTALIVIGCILLFIIFLLLSPLRLKFSYNQNTEIKQKVLLSIHFLFFIYRIPIDAQEVETAAEATLETGEDVSMTTQILGIFKKNDLHTILKLLKLILREVKDTSKMFLSKLKLDECRFKMIVAGEDAAQTAINYGYACAGIYPVFSLLFEYIKCRKSDITVDVDFAKKDFEFDVLVNVHITLLFFIIGSVFALKRFMPIIRWVKKDKQGIPNPRKMKK